MIKQTLYTVAGSCLIAGAAVIGWGTDTVHATDHMSKEEAGEIVTDKYGGDVLNVEEESDGAIYEVEVENSDEGRIEVDIDAAEGSGDILEVEYEDKDDEKFIISKEEAEKAATDKYGGNVKETEIEHEEDADGNYVLVYEVELRDSNEGDIEVDVDAHSGDLFDSEQEDGDDDKDGSDEKGDQISRDEALQIVRDKYGGDPDGDMDDAVEEEDDGDTWEVEVVDSSKGNLEVDVDAYSGDILEIEVDDDDEDEVSFPDVKKKDSGKGSVGGHYDAIMSLAEKGIIKGREDGKFHPWDNINRGQIANMLAKTQDLEAPEDVGEALSDYDDVNASSDYADSIAAVTEAGIFSGYNGAFGEFDDLTRGQMATVLVHAFDLDQVDQGDDADVNLKNVGKSHQDAVQTLANLGITNELDDFRADEPVNRAQVATFLDKAAEKS